MKSNVMTMAIAVVALATAAQATTHYVSASAGDDATGDGTAEHPWATVNYAISDASTVPGDEIRIAAGVYVENVNNTSKANLTFRGGYRADWTRDLRNARTEIRAPAGAYYNVGVVFNLGDDAPSNRIEGVTLSGGTYGVQIANPFGQRIDKVIATNNVYHGIYFRYFAGLKKGHFDDVVISSSLVAHNGHATPLKSGQESAGIFGANYNVFVPSIHILNCTIVSNGVSGVSLGTTEVHVRNTLIADNGWSEATKAKNEYETLQYGSQLVTKMSHVVIYNRMSPRGISLYSTVSTSYTLVRHPVAILNVDPLIDEASYVPRQGSPLVKNGEDLSDYAFPVTEDVYGNAWAPGAYDIGCIKSVLPKVHSAVIPDVYVAVDGDDSNSGATPGAPLKSIGVASLIVEEGGTIHVGPGEFKEFFAISTPQITVEGAGRNRTVLNAIAAANASAVHVATNNVTVRDLAIENARIGLYIANLYSSSNVVVENCRIANNVVGIFQNAEKTTPPSGYGLYEPVGRFSHCVVEDCTQRALYMHQLGAPAAFDSCLFARNGGTDNAEYGGPWLSGTKAYFYNCSFVSNVNYGVYTYCGNNSRDILFYNCLFAGSPRGWWNYSGGYGRGANCVFDCETNFVFGSFASWVAGKTNEILQTAARLDWSPRKWAHPLADSPAARGGKSINGGTDSYFDVTTDLNYVERPLDKWFIGCYAPSVGGMSVIVK